MYKKIVKERFLNSRSYLMFEVVLARIIINNRRQITSESHLQHAIRLNPTVFQELASKTISRNEYIDMACVSCM